METETKKCSRCERVQPLTDFHRCAASQDGHAYLCKTCMKEYARNWNQKNPLKRRQYKKKWEAEHPEEVKEAKRLRYHADLEHSRAVAKAWRENNPEKYAAQRERVSVKRRAEGLDVYYRHGVTLEQKVEILECQGGGCRLCDAELPLMGTRTHVDHNHSTGEIRGILCGKCNASLGWFEMRSERVLAYLAAPPVHPGKDRSVKRTLRGPDYSPSVWPLKTHCKNGHEFTPETVYVFGDGSRACAICARTRRRAAKTHCKNGHLLAHENVFVKANGTRQCVQCAATPKGPRTRKS